jgi:uncharacterized protein
MQTIERRLTAAPATGAITLRENGKGNTITGYAAVFYRPGDSGTEYQLQPGVVEHIAPEAFSKALRDRQDARGLFNHDANQLLGRVGSGTVRLAADAKGLRYEIDAPDTQLGQDLRVLVGRGDLFGSSFSFVVGDDFWSEAKGGVVIRTIREVDRLFDVGPVVFPAYEGTTTGLRTDGSQYGTDAESVAARLRQLKEQDAVAIRLRVLEVNGDLGPWAGKPW